MNFTIAAQNNLAYKLAKSDKHLTINHAAIIISAPVVQSPPSFKGEGTSYQCTASLNTDHGMFSWAIYVTSGEAGTIMDYCDLISQPSNTELINDVDFDISK